MPDQNDTQTIAIAGTFTVEPVKASLNFWMEELSIPSRVEFAPYNQVFQVLLDPTSLLSTNHNGINVLLVRSADWLRCPGRASAGRELTINIELEAQHNTTQLVKAVRQFAQGSRVPLLLVFCPNPNEGVVATEHPAILAGSERQAKDELNNLCEVNVVTATELMSLYPVADFYDPHGDRSSHIPFTPACFASIGTMVSRRIFRLKSAPFKAIVLDCDQTLWKGVCAEDGPFGVEVDNARQWFQEFMKSQQGAGMILCLCSKNDPEDISRVFESRSDMPLRPEHLSASRINWNSKSANIRSLAEELQIGLSSFIFIDDDPVECAEVRINCPDVLTLQLPSDPGRIPEFLQHIWPLDRIRITSEDRQRALFYRQSLERTTAHQTLGMQEFLRTLDLTIHISEMRVDQLPRVAQLVERTNQFNLTTIRRSELELRNLWESGTYDFLTVEVGDRYGDYGLVGLTVFSKKSTSLVVDTFLLSCRALGRGVEHQMLARLGKLAKEQSLEFLTVPYVETARNLPALDFLRSVAIQSPESRGEELWFSFSSELVAGLTHPAFQDNPPRSIQGALSVASAQARTVGQFEKTMVLSVRQAQQLSRIAEQLYAPADILAVITKRNRNARPKIGVEFVPPEWPLERELAQIWSEVLGIESVGTDDNFFALGGHSLSAVQITSKIRRTFNVDFPLQMFLEAPVLGRQAQQLGEILLEHADANELEELMNEVEQVFENNGKSQVESNPARNHAEG